MIARIGFIPTLPQLFIYKRWMGGWILTSETYVGSDTLHCYELKTFLVGSVHCAIGKEHFSSEQQFK